MYDSTSSKYHQGIFILSGAILEEHLLRQSGIVPSSCHIESLNGNLDK